MPIELELVIEEPIELGASQTGGTVLSVNGKKGDVVLTADDVNAVEKVAGKGLSTEDYTTAEKNKLASFTEIFTTALKSAYDWAVSWITTNGTNLLNHLSATNNPHSTTYSQVGAEPANANIQTHIGTTGNPHGTTYSDVGAAASGHNHSGVYEPANSNIQGHISSTNNPHGTSDANLSTTDITTNNASTSKHGFFPKLPTATGKFLRDDMTWQEAGWETSINLDNTIFVSQSGSNTTGDGTIIKPYQTLEHAVSQANPIKATFVGDTTLNSNTISVPLGITSEMTVGRMVCGNGIPYGTTIIGAGSQYSLTISNNATVTATGVTLTVEEEITIKTFGNFEAYSNLFKDGVKWDFGNSTITWGNLTLFDISAVCKHDFKVVGGNFVGIHANSTFFKNTFAQNANHFETFDNVTINTSTTGYIFVDNTGLGTIQMINVKARAIFGRISSLAKAYHKLELYGYGLLSGLSITGYDSVIDGTLESPAAVQALRQSEYNSKSIIVNSKILGSVALTNRNTITINGSIVGTNCTLGDTGSVYETIIVNGTINANMSRNGYANIIINGKWVGTIGQSAGTITLNSDCSYISLTLTGRGRFINNGGQGLNSGALVATLNGSEAYLENNATWYGGSGIPVTITNGKFVNNGIIVMEYVWGAPVIQNGGTVINKGTIRFNYNDGSTFRACIEKTAGTFINQGGNLRNILNYSPIRCLANTAASKDIYILGGTSNCDGLTAGMLFAFGKQIRLYYFTDNTNASFDFFDGTSTTNISVVGAGKTGVQLADEVVVLIQALGTVKHVYRAGIVVYIMGKGDADITATSLVNLITDTPIALSYNPNPLILNNLNEDTSYNWD